MNPLIEINEELRTLIPPLTSEEYQGLEQSIIKEGCRDSIILWDYTIVDGHNRYKICTEHNLSYNTIQKHFNDITEVKEWILVNQLSRRNITPYQRFLVVTDLEKIYKKKAKENLKVYGGNQYQSGPLANSPKIQTSINTRKELSKLAGVGEKTFDQLKKIEEKASEDIKNKLRIGTITINQAYNDIKKEERKSDIEKQIEEIKNIKNTDGLFDIIVFDPPWKYETEYNPDNGFGRVACPYPEMSFNELSKINLPSSDNCYLWLWTTQQFIWDAKTLMEIYGFEYRSILVWDKEKMGIGTKLRYQCEFCLLGIKGNPLWTAHDLRDIIREPRREHSRKPDTFYQMIEDNFYGRFLDYFSRNQFSDKWDVYGNDTNKYNKQ